MAAGALAMSGRERERLIVIAQVCGKVLSQGAAAERLGICVRQVKRLVRAYRGEGDAGLVSRQRGPASTPSWPHARTTAQPPSPQGRG